MTLINYVAADGTRSSLDIENGTTVMQGAVLNGVEGIVGECGGSAMCATCHVYVDEHHIDSLETMDELEDAMLDSDLPAQTACGLDAFRPVGGDPFVDRDADQLDVASLSEELREEERGRARILPAAHPDGNALAALEIDLRPKLALRAALDEREEVIATEVLAAVPNPFDGGSAAAVARHDSRKRTAGLRGHGPGGGPVGGGPVGGGTGTIGIGCWAGTAGNGRTMRS